ncbi:hypothetical protein SCLCIDRAFT_1024550 [Scleroderma citrinum Foug A]|uniref:Uncharacterized protein n=1 Tax=Scleroderma citrinum Foug A TaxID=1036808 RepID=A0A0C3DSV2_9AGAM|nr:hypothetical protein SCLCIDRAFT_1024550 [Scleroderma citrinum Foug A]
MKIEREQLFSISDEVKELVIQYLDLSRTYANQSQYNIDRFEKEALRQIPLLRQYEGGWATPLVVRRLFRNKTLPNVRGFEKANLPRSYTHALRDRRIESPPARHAHPFPSPAITLLQFLEPIKPNVSQYFCHFVSMGLFDDDGFQKFLTYSLAVKEGFFRLALRDMASEEELNAILGAIEELHATL